jgi:hypothetical protein
MTYFYIGIRIDDIVMLNPNSSKTFPTTVTLRNGQSITCSGTWEENARNVNRILNDNERERAMLGRAPAPLRLSGDWQRHFDVVKAWNRSGKHYMPKQVRRALDLFITEVT